jgi:SagB-type dehydrogenase family enzyme
MKPDAPSWLEAFRRRRSNRSFSLRPVGFGAFSELLACLMEVTMDGRAKRLHGSPGGLYPIQVYLHIKPGRVEGVEAGTYYYHPVNHCLVSLTRDVDLDRDIHIPFINAPTFDRAAFSMFLIADLSAIAPSYGHYSLHFSTIEAGLIAQTLELMAPACGIGLCQIGSLQFDRVRSLFRLDRPHVLIHSLVGGLLGDRLPATAADAPSSSCSAVEDTLGRLRELSDDEVRRLLEANRRVDDPDTPLLSPMNVDQEP